VLVVAELSSSEGIATPQDVEVAWREEIARRVEDLLVAKRAARRPQDLVDVARLEKVRAKEVELGRKRDR
jgi:hypothetical protein